MNRNQHRLLNDHQIKDITAQVALDLIQYANESAEYLMTLYLSGDVEGMFDMISDWIEAAEDEVKRQSELDSAENSFEDDHHTPDYEF
jgi:hypothetical protein